MNRPTLALLIPAYNAAGYLPWLMQSVRGQTEPFDEIWVYDDCSTDDTAVVAKALGARVVGGSDNRGCTFGKHVLVQCTSCDWVHFHDADDLLLPHFVSRARHWMSDTAAEAVVFGCEERCNDTGEVIGVSVPDDGALSADPVGYTIRHKINAISGIYRRDTFIAAGGFDLDPEVLYNEDQAFHCSLARAGIQFRADPTVAIVNLRRRGSMWTANRDKAVRAHFHVMKKALAHSEDKSHRSAIAERLWHVTAAAASLLDWRTADEAAALAMQLSGPSTSSTGRLFKLLCHLSPRLALRSREWLIRMFKPRAREGYPGWRVHVRLM